MRCTGRAGPVSIANALTVGISSDRRIKVYASAAVHVVLDLTGTLA